MGYAISATAEYDADLTLLHVVEHVPRSANPEELLATCQQRLGKLITAEARETLKVKEVVRRGKPYEEIVRYAQETQVDLINMAARGADALDRAVFGSTTYRVIQLGPCPVLAVRT